MIDLFRTQRSLRAFRKAAIQRGVVAILDIGTSKIACIILQFFGSETNRSIDGVGPMAGQANFKVIGAATTRSRGVRFGEITQMRETEAAIMTAMQAAQKMAEVRVDHVIACFSGAEPRSYGLNGEWELANSVVEDADIANVLAACDVPPLGEGREILHAQPVNFSLDHRDGLGDPRGQIGNRLSCDVHLLSVDAGLIQNVLYCIKKCDMELAGIAMSSYTAALSALVEDEQELGAACIDMGGGSTGISLFMKKHMIYADSVRMGGDHVTSDISKGLQISTSLAERIKTKHGGVFATGMDDREMLEIGGDSGDWEKDRRTVSRAELIGIIRPRVAEILEEVRERLDAAGFDSLPSQQIVLTGGASQIPGLADLASRILGVGVRMGRPMRIHGLPQALTGPSFAASVGLCLFAASPQDEFWDFDLPETRYPSKSLKRVARWFKENW